MDAIEFEKELKGLVDLFFGESSKQEILTIRKVPPQRLTANIQNYLENLRVYIKYQKFDLEAIRRDNEVLRELIRKANR